MKDPEALRLLQILVDVGNEQNQHLRDMKNPQKGADAGTRAFAYMLDMMKEARIQAQLNN